MKGFENNYAVFDCMSDFLWTEINCSITSEAAGLLVLSRFPQSSRASSSGDVGSPDQIAQAFSTNFSRL